MMTLSEEDKQWIREQISAQLEEVETRILGALNDWADLTVSLAERTAVLAEWLDKLEERALASEVQSLADADEKNADVYRGLYKQYLRQRAERDNADAD